MGQSPTVFVIDPDPDTRFAVQRAIPQAGFVLCGQAGLGTEAVSDVVERRPNIILCGLKEPITRVVQTIESITYALPEVPVVVYAESADIATIRKAMLAGARDFLEAPFKPDELRRSLSQILEWGERRQLRESSNSVLGPEGAIITVFAAKGGVGKTTIAANLAVALVRAAGQSVALVDADDTFGDVSGTLTFEPGGTVLDGLRGMDGLDDESLKECFAVHDSGLVVAAAPASPFEWREVQSEKLEQLLRRLARRFDIVVVDTGGTLSEVSQTTLEAASLVLWITTPEYASIRDSLQALQAFRSMRVAEDRIRVVLNVTTPEMEIRPKSIEEALGQEIFWTVPYDRVLRRSTQLGEAITESHPESPAAQTITELALALSGMPRPVRNGKLIHKIFGGNGGGLLRRGVSKRSEEARA